jgi:60 kDa SS-A/Ro ribonucleoprotein
MNPKTGRPKMTAVYRKIRSGMPAGQVRTHEGGVAFAVDHWTRLRRFLVLGSDGGTFYVGERELTAENTRIVAECLDEDAARTVAEIVAVSEAGRAPKQEPALFALALAAAHADPTARAAALTALPRVCRTGTHLFHFAAYVASLRGWGRGLRRAIGGWYNAKPLDELAYQALKYRQRDGWSHADLLRLAHPKPVLSGAEGTIDAGRNALFRWIVDGELQEALATAAPAAYAQLAAYTELASFELGASSLENGAIDLKLVARSSELIRQAKLPREAIPTALLTNPEVWAALLDEMPMTAMLRNLGTMSKVGLLTPGSDAARTVVARLGDGERLRRARVHPLAVLAATKVYAQGHGERSQATWRPVPAVVDALDAAFYAAFGNVAPTGKRLRLALDISASMDGARIAGLPFLSAREASACMALVTAVVEPNHEFVAYSDKLVPVAISPRQRLDDVVKTLKAIPMGGTFCALPVIDALKSKTAVDAFVSYTDSETWDASGRSVVRPWGWTDQAPAKPMAECLAGYRERTGIAARSVVVATSATEVSLADPHDALSLDVAGFDTAAPQLIADFMNGVLS